MTEYIPHDVTLEILSKLPPKSLIRFLSVSKLWSNVITSKDFARSFLSRSRSCPRLLITLMDFNGKCFIFSAPEHKVKDNHDDKSSTVLARHDMTVSDTNYYHIFSPPVNGFLCRISGGRRIEVCNPTTKQRVKLPDVDLKQEVMHAHLGYDPVEDQYKVLCIITFKRKLDKEQEHLVCTVRSGQKLEWRKIHTTARDINSWKGICMGGVIYYCVGHTRIARFDVRSEKIDFIQAPEDISFSKLVNYQGKLAVASFPLSHIRLWILQDSEKQEWSSVMTCDVPPECRFCGSVCAGEIHTNEVMLDSNSIWLFRDLSKRFRVYYCNMITKNIRRVEVDGISESELRRNHGLSKDELAYVLCFPGYVESITYL